MLSTTGRPRLSDRTVGVTTFAFRWFTCYTFLTQLVFPVAVWSQRICPGDQRCSITADGASILRMQCDGYGSLNSLPVACSDTRPVSALKIGSSGTIVTSLQARILDGLQVQMLDLSRLGIQSIDPSAFDVVGMYLKELHLSGNAIKSLPDNVFKNVQYLTSLDLSNNQLTTIGYSTIYGLFQVTSLDISHNQLSNLLRDTFSAMLSLKYLSLNDNVLTTIPEFLFNKLSTLVRLNLQNNLITTITSNSLSGMPNLVELNMKGNRLPVLPVGVFDAVGSLQTLLLANNSIRQVNQNPFSAQISLITLDLSDNLIETVTPDWFTAAGPRLQALWLNGNRILTINVTSLAWTLPELLQLDLSDNLLTSLNNVFSNWHSLVSLAISGNPLGLRNGGQGLTESLSGMESLRSLDLRGSCLTSMEPGLQLPNLKMLLLASNQLTNVSRNMLAGVSKLQTLDISDNDIASIEPLSFAPLTGLLRLDFSSNALTGSQLQSAGISRNTTVDISWNAVTSVESVPRQDGGVYLHGNPLACGGCDVGGLSSSWWPADQRLLLDANQTTCLQGNRQPTRITCQCPSSTTSSYACNSPLPVDDTRYLFGIQQSPRTCPYDVNILNPYRPRFTAISARTSSQTSIVVNWNVTDLRHSAVFVRILVAESPDCLHASATAVNISESTTFASTSEYSVNVTSCDVTNLTPSAMYAVCGQVVVSSTGNSSNTSTSDTACTCVQVSFDAVVQDATSATPQSIASSSLSTASNLFLIIVIAVPAGVLLLILVVICVVVMVCCARRRRRTQQKGPPPTAAQHFASEQPPPIATIVIPTSKVEQGSHVTPSTEIDLGVDIDIDDDDTLHLAHQSQLSLSVYDNAYEHI